MKLKKLPRYLALFSLTSGASIILGFLSFGGVLAITPILPLAFAAFGLSVAYDGEIYLQNIKGSLSKLFKPNHLKRQLANEYLLTHFPIKAIKGKPRPQFFKDYLAQLSLLHEFDHKHLDKESLAEKSHIEKTLRDMEKWFATQLFADEPDRVANLSPYENTLRTWLKDNQQQEWQLLLKKRHKTFLGMQGFGGLSGLFMAIGTTYLLTEAFATVPFLASIPLIAWPILIVPMAAIAGAAYGLLTYNAVTDMITNKTLQKWWDKFKADLGKGLTLPNLFNVTSTAILISLAIALTICTAGTWWTVVKQTRPILAWLGKMPSFIMDVINPIVTGLSAVVFNLQNTNESLGVIDHMLCNDHKKDNLFTRVSNAMTALRAHENMWQIFNPARLVLKLTLTPLRFILFIGHLISIGLTADRVPGVSEKLSALLGIISEGFEDMHYFIDHEHHHEHNARGLLQERLEAAHGHTHDQDLPTQFLKLIFTPLYFLAAGWDYGFSQRNKEPLSFRQAWRKHYSGYQNEERVIISQTAQRPSPAWQVEHVISRIERYKAKHLTSVHVGRELAQEKSKKLTTLQQELRGVTNPKEMTAKLDRAKSMPIFGAHRFFNRGTTNTTGFLENLPQRVNAPMA